MKITTDVNLVNQHVSAGNVKNSPGKSGQSGAASDAMLANRITSRLQQERTLIDAMAIAQVSRSVVQKAINVSSKLSSIAYQAMSTGNIDVNDLNTQISGIQDVMRSYGENVLAPPDGQGAGIQARLQNGLRELGDGAGELAGKKAVSPEVFETIGREMGSLAVDVDREIESYGMKLQAGGVKSVADDNIPGLAAGVARDITGNPGAALAAQGNVLAEAARSLAMA